MDLSDSCRRLAAPNQPYINLPPPQSVVDVSFEEPGKPVKVATWLDVANTGHQSFRVDQIVKRFIVQIQLPGNTDHHAVEFLFSECAKGTNAELTT